MATTSETLTRNANGTSTNDGYVLQNTTAATGGAQQQFSPCQHFVAHGWITNAGGSDQTQDFLICLQPTTGGTNSTTSLVYYKQIAGGGYTAMMAFGSGANGYYIKFGAGASAGANTNNAELQCSAGDGSTTTAGTCYIIGPLIIAPNNNGQDVSDFPSSEIGQRYGSGSCLIWSSTGDSTIGPWDTNICRSAAGAMTVGNGTALDTSATLALKSIVTTGINNLGANTARATSQLSKTNSTVEAVPGVTFSLAASTNYSFHCNVLWSSVATAGGQRLSFTYSGTTTSFLAYGQSAANTSTAAGNSVVRTTTVTSNIDFLTGSTGADVATIDGFVVTNAAGNLALVAAQSLTNATPSVVDSGSNCTVWPVV